MKIIRWLLRHSFLFLLIVIVIYGYMFWGNLLGKETPAGRVIAYLSSEFAEVADFADAVKAKQTQLNGDKESPQITPKALAVTDSLIDVENDKKTNKTHLADTMKLTESQGMAPLNQSQSATPIEENKNRALNGALLPPEVQRQGGGVDSQGKVLGESQRRDAVTATWILARQSFYQRNYRLSEQSYQSVIDRTDDNFDAYGELGNVYFNQGKKQQAATAYFEAAAIFIRKGQIDRARSLIGLLNLLDKDKAIELQELIKTASS